MRLTYDATTDVAYLELRRLAPGEALGPNLLLGADRAFHALVIADFTEADGMLVGFELVRASTCLPPAVLSTAERIDGRNLGERLLVRLSARSEETGHVQ